MLNKWFALFWTLGLLHGADWSPRYGGLRFGASATSIDDFYHQTEAVLRWELHHPFDLGRSWWELTDVDFAVGTLRSQDSASLVSSLGPLIEIGRGQFPVSLAGGVSPTFLSEHEFNHDDFGLRFQFTSHAGFNVDLGKGWSLGYRFQHMSNAHLGSPNPGLNMHALTLLVRL